MRDPRTIVLVHPVEGTDPEHLIEDSFPDIQRGWDDAAQAEGRLCILVYDQQPQRPATIGDFMTSGWAALVPLAVYAFDTGVGTRPVPPGSAPAAT